MLTPSIFWDSRIPWVDGKAVHSPLSPKAQSHPPLAPEAEPHLPLSDDVELHMRPVKLTNLSGEVMKVTWMTWMTWKRSQMACACLVTLWMLHDCWWFLCSYWTSMKYQWTSLNVYWVLQIIELNGSCSRAMLNDQRVLERVITH